MTTDRTNEFRRAGSVPLIWKGGCYHLKVDALPVAKQQPASLAGGAFSTGILNLFDHIMSYENPIHRPPANEHMQDSVSTVPAICTFDTSHACDL